MTSNNLRQNELKNQLIELPTDVKRKVFSLIGPKDAAHICLVCKSLQQAAQHELVWESFAKSRWRCPHKAVINSWKSVYTSGNGWDTCSLQPSCVHPFPQRHQRNQGQSFRWKFEAGAADYRGSILKWASDSCQVLRAIEPEKASSWTFQDNFYCDRAISGCCTLGRSSEQVVLGDVYGNLHVQKPIPPGPPVETGRKRQREELGDSSEASESCSTFKVSSTETLRGARELCMAKNGKLWLLADAESGFSGRIAVVDTESQKSTTCRDFMDGYVYHGLCEHPGNPQGNLEIGSLQVGKHAVQVAVVVGAHRSSVCPSCTHEEIAEPVCAPLWSAAALCGHRSRCNLGSVSVMPQVVACPGRDHYVITSHHDCAVCAWDVRNLVYPVHEGRLDHMAEPRHHFGLSNALWRAQNQAMTLSCSHDTMLGHAANGMLWHFDLSAMLGWASPTCSEPSQRGCWLTHRGSSEAAPGSWAHPTPMGLIPGGHQACRGIYVLPESVDGSFLASGWSDCRVRTADSTRYMHGSTELGLHGPDICSGLIHGAEPLHAYAVEQELSVNCTPLEQHQDSKTAHEHSARECAAANCDNLAVAGDELITSQPGGSAHCSMNESVAWVPGDNIWEKHKLSVVDWKMPFGINLYKLQP